MIENIMEEIKRLKEERDRFIKSYEDLRKDLGMLVGKVSINEKEINNLQFTVQELKTMLNKLKSDIQVNENFTKELENKLNNNKISIRNLTYFTTKLDSNLKNISSNFESNKVIIKKLQQTTSSLLYNSRDLRTKTERDISLLDNKVAIIESKMNMMSAEGITAILSDLTKSIAEIKDIMKTRIKGLEHDVKEISKRIENYELQFKLLDTMNTLSRLGPNPLKIKNSLEVLDILIERMKHIGLWNEDKHISTINFLEELADSWVNYGYEKIAELYKVEAEKLRKKSIEKMSARV